jgi:hypothetical protein
VSYANEAPDHFIDSHHPITGLIRFSNGYNMMATKNGLVLGWQVPAKIEHLKTTLVRLSDYVVAFPIR